MASNIQVMDYNKKDIDGDTPLLNAAKCGNFKLASQILSENVAVDYTIKDNDGRDIFDVIKEKAIQDSNYRQKVYAWNPNISAEFVLKMGEVIMDIIHNIKPPSS